MATAQLHVEQYHIQRATQLSSKSNETQLHAREVHMHSYNSARQTKEQPNKSLQRVSVQRSNGERHYSELWHRHWPAPTHRLSLSSRHSLLHNPPHCRHYYLLIVTANSH